MTIAINCEACHGTGKTSCECIECHTEHWRKCQTCNGIGFFRNKGEAVAKNSRADAPKADKETT